MDRAERGSVSIEVAILTPVFLLLIALATVAGRTAIAQGAIEIAAHDAARAASISRTREAADANARAAAMESLRSQGIDCDPAIDPDLDDFAEPVGPPPNPADPPVVSVRITCVLSFVDLPMPGLPGDTTLTASFTSPLDWYRSRALRFANSEASSATNPSRSGL